MLKIGDKLHCIKDCIVNGSDDKISCGNNYNIINIGYFYDRQVLSVINDIGHEHKFYVDSYQKWFTNVKEERKLKLEKLCLK